MFLQYVSAKGPFNINSLTNAILNPNKVKRVVSEFREKASMSMGEMLFGLKENEVTMALENVMGMGKGEALSPVGSLSATYGILADEIIGYIPTANDSELSPEMELFIQKLRELRIKTRDGIADALLGVGSVFGYEGMMKLLEEMKETLKQQVYTPLEAELRI